jgi:putative chitinase
MSMIERLIAAGVNPTQAKAFAEPLKAAMALFDISTDARIAAFLAQAMIESQSFTRLEENLFYTTPARIDAVFSAVKSIEEATLYVRNPQRLANKVYANRNGNGDEASGDGWIFRGRGLFQLTGRANYKAASEGVGMGAVYLHKPSLVSEPSDAALTAAWYWSSRGCNQLIDADNFDATTRLINGPAMLHKHERAAAFHHNLSAFA